MRTVLPFGPLAPAQRQNDIDLWGVNPQTDQLYSTRDRRAMMRDRDMQAGMTPTFQNVLPDASWDQWYDDVANASYARTGLTPAQLPTRMVGGASPADSNQLRGLPVQGHGIADDPDSTYNTNQGPFGVFATGTGGIESRPAQKVTFPSLDAAHRVQNRKR